MPYILLTLAAVFWGGNYVVGHLLVAHNDPVILSEARWLITALLLFLLYHHQVRQAWPDICRSFRAILFLSLFGQVLFPLTLYIGLQYTTSLNAAIYMSATPAMVLLINKIIFKEHISKNNIIGVIFSSLGVIYLILQGDFTHFDTFKNLNQGDFWAMGSALSWALYCSFLRLKSRAISGNAFVTISSLIGSLLLLPVLLFSLANSTLPDMHTYLEPVFLSGLIYLVIFPSWLAYLFWNRGIQDIGATRGEIYTHLIPLSGGVLSIIFLHTTLHKFHVVSAILIAVGIWLCSKKTQSQPNVIQK